MKTKNNKGAGSRPPGGRLKTKPTKVKGKVRPYLRLKVWPFVWSGIVGLGTALYSSMGNNPNALYLITLLITACLFYATHGWVEHLKHSPFRTYSATSYTPRVATLSKLNLPLPSPSKIAREAANAAANTALTPTQIRSRINSASPGQRADIARSFIDVPVTWTLALLSADPSPNDDDIILYFRDVKDDLQSLHSPVMIKAMVPLKGNENLRMADRNERFQVQGTIKEIYEMGTIALKDCSLEKLSPAK